MRVFGGLCFPARSQTKPGASGVSREGPWVHRCPVFCSPPLCVRERVSCSPAALPARQPAHHRQPCLVHPQDEPRRARLPGAAVRPGAEQILWTRCCISSSPGTGDTSMSPFMGEETAAPVEWRHRDFRSVCLLGLHRAPQQSPTANPSPLGPPGAISAPPLVALLLPRGQVAPARLCCPHRPQRPSKITLSLCLLQIHKPLETSAPAKASAQSLRPGGTWPAGRRGRGLLSKQRELL